MNKNTFVDSLFLRFKLLLSHCSSVPSEFLSPKPFMHCEIIDCCFSLFFVEIPLKKENLKYFLGTTIWASKLVYRSPKRPEYGTAIFALSFRIYSKENRSLTGDHQQITFEFFNRTCLLIFLLPFFPYKFPFLIFVKFLGHKNANSEPFFTLYNSFTSNFIVQYFILS